jgi:pyruvate,water dikinase
MSESYGFQQLEWIEEEDANSHALWLNDLVHVPVPWKPLAMTQWLSSTAVGNRLAAANISFPGSHGWDIRIKDGHYYLALLEVAPEEIPEREKVYRKRVQPIIDDFEGEWNKTMAAWYPVVNSFKERCHPLKLRELSDAALFGLLDDYLMNFNRRCWVEHFEWLYISMDLYNLFADTCREEIGVGIEDPLFKALLGGFDTIEFRIDREMYRLSDMAKEAGIDQMFMATQDDEELMTQIQARSKCKKWLKEYQDFLQKYGWRVSGWTNIGTPSWIEKPSEGLRHIKAGIAKGGVLAADVEREALVKRRGEAKKEILARVSSEKRDWFAKLMEMGMRSSWLQEEHAINSSMLDAAIARHIFMEYGRRFAETGVIDRQEDILFLVLPEIKKEIVPSGSVNLCSYVNRHREEWQNNCKAVTVPFIGDLSILAQWSWKNPLARIFSGIPNVRPELNADLYAASSTQGIVEGVARVIIEQADLGALKPGEILVTVCTNALWTPIFSIIAGLVTDAGGSLSHALIVARENGVPAVIGTLEATQKIKTGDRIKIDADNGCVYILG